MHPDALAARLACILLGYLFGSFLTAEVVARVVSGKSARQLGTGNPGMANIMAQLGKGAGLLTLVLGHNYPAWARFRGGKGVAVTCVWLVLYLPFWGTLCCIAGGALVLWLGYLPLGAVVIPALAILPAWLSYGPESGILTLALAIIMFSRHYHGLLRIRQGTEPRFFQRRNPK